MNELALLLISAVAVGGFVGALERCIRSTPFALGLVAVVTFVDVAGVPLETVFGGFRVSAIDAVFGLLGIAAVARLLRTPQVRPMQWLVIALVALAFGAIASGVFAFGPGAAVNEARVTVRFLAGVLFFSTVEQRPDTFDRLAVVGGVYVAGLVGLTVLRWVALAAGVEGWFMAGEDSVRAIESFQTLVIVQALLIVWGTRRPVPRAATVAAPILLAVVVLLQHRTLWVALAVGGLVLGVRSRRVAMRVVPAAIVAILLGTVAAFTVLGGTSEVRAGLEESASNADTFAWRIEGWRQLVFETGPDDVGTLATGLPFGSGYERYIAGGIVDASPHNYLVETYLRLGAVGAALLVALYGVALSRLRSGSGSGRFLHGDPLFAAVVVQCIYLMTSHPSVEQAIILGLALAAGFPARTSSVPVGARPGNRSSGRRPPRVGAPT